MPTKVSSWQFLRKSIGGAPPPLAATNWLYLTVKDELDGWLTLAVPCGQPEPFAVSRRTVNDGGWAAAAALADVAVLADAGPTARQENRATPSAASLSMSILSSSHP